jgi:Cys-rich repeat protein
MRARALPAASALLIALGGCGTLLGIEPGHLDESSPASSSSGGGGSSGVSECDTASDCPAPPFPECREVTCKAHRCLTSDAAAGTPTASQVAGDCQQIECDGHGLVRSAAFLDPRDDGRECTDDLCAEGVPANAARPAGTPCQQGGGAVCTGTGECVGCLSDADCPGQICKAASCVPLGCSNHVKDSGETDTDCGGPCSPCGDSLHCATGSDCQSGVCVAKLCQSPTCADAAKNGSEADVDCGGGMCVPCVDGKSCAAAADCLGGVCAANLCCTPALDGMTCLGRCGPIVNNCGQTVPCGGCAPPGTCVQGNCVCMPDSTMKTCAGKCGVIPNNCGQLLDCGPCGPGGPGGP